MNSPPAWQCYAQDFLTDVGEWSDEAVGIYIRLLNYQWVNRSIPSDIEDIVNLCNSDLDAFTKHWDKYIQYKFKKKTEDGRLQNKRLEEYWLYLMGNRKKCSGAGKLSAEKRRLKSELDKLNKQIIKDKEI